MTRFLSALFCLSFLPLCAQEDSCNCSHVMQDSWNMFLSRYDVYETGKPYTGICTGYSKDGLLLKRMELKDGYVVSMQFNYVSGKKFYVYDGTKHDSICGHLLHYQDVTGFLSDEHWIYYSHGKKKEKVIEYFMFGAQDQVGTKHSEYYEIYPAKDSIALYTSYLSCKSGYLQGTAVTPDGFYDKAVIDGYYREFSGGNPSVTVLEGNYFRGCRTGKWITRYDNGQLKAEGNYVNFNYDGEWKTWYANGQLSSHYSYVNGNLDGHGMEWYENGQLKLDAYYDGYYGAAVDSVYTEYYGNGQLKIKYEIKKFPAGKSVAFRYVGTYTTWFENGQKESERNYDTSGYNNGPETTWYPNGVVKSILTDSIGVQVGPEKEYYDTGVLKRVTSPPAPIFPRLVIDYWPNGNIKSNVCYGCSGMKDSLCSYYYPNGKIRREESWKAGSKNGKWTYTDSLGNVTRVVNYHDMEVNGHCYDYFPGGKLKRDFTYKDNLRDGKCREWNADGKLVYDKKFSRGKMKTGRGKKILPVASDSLRNAYARDAKIIAYWEVNMQDSLYGDSITASRKFQAQIENELLLLNNYFSKDYPFLDTLHIDPATGRTWMEITFPYTGRRIPGDTMGQCRDLGWPVALDSVIALYHLVPVPGECYSAGNYGNGNLMIRQFTSDLPLNQNRLDTLLHHLDAHCACSGVYPQSQDFYEPPKPVFRYGDRNFSVYTFCSLANGVPQDVKNYYSGYTGMLLQFTFYVYPDGSIDLFNHDDDPQPWSPDYPE
ncbi:MAG TPA: hypothetical protein VFU15_08130 [Bacteroidia bacterium]|nr:hypothetical protein [Bacteroidia bacterium]